MGVLVLDWGLALTIMCICNITVFTVFFLFIVESFKGGRLLIKKQLTISKLTDLAYFLYVILKTLVSNLLAGN